MANTPLTIRVDPADLRPVLDLITDLATEVSRLAEHLTTLRDANRADGAMTGQDWLYANDGDIHPNWTLLDLYLEHALNGATPEQAARACADAKTARNRASTPERIANLLRRAGDLTDHPRRAQPTPARQPHTPHQEP
jgi:hypothetical protein